MKSRFDIERELKELNTSLPLEKLPEVFSVPDGYFEGLADSVLLKIRAQEGSVTGELEALSPLLAGISRKMPFSVPDGYFGQNTENIQAFVSDESLPPLLQQAGKGMPYQVPEGYFDRLPDQLLAAASPKPAAKVIAMRPVKWMRYALAGAIAGILVLGGIRYFAGSGSVSADKHPHQWIASKLKNVSNSELEEFIKTTDATAVNGTETAQGKPANHAEIKKLLNDVSNSELDEFLSQVPGESEDLSQTN